MPENVEIKKPKPVPYEKHFELLEDSIRQETEKIHQLMDALREKDIKKIGIRMIEARNARSHSDTIEHALEARVRSGL